MDGELKAGSLQKRPEAWEGRTWSVQVEHPPYTKEACFSRGVLPEFRGSGYTHYKAPSTPRESGNRNKDNTPSSGGSESVWHLPVQAQIPAAEPTLSILLTSLAALSDLLAQQTRGGRQAWPVMVIGGAQQMPSQALRLSSARCLVQRYSTVHHTACIGLFSDLLVLVGIPWWKSCVTFVNRSWSGLVTRKKRN